jgi:predicted Zn-dependent protease
MSLAMWAYAQAWFLRVRFEGGDPALIAEISDRADAAVQSNPESDFAGKVRSEVRLHLFGEIETAKRAAARVAQLNPNYGALKLIEAEIALAEGAWDHVRDITSRYFEAHSPDPDEPYMRYLRSVAETLDGCHDAAASWVKEAIEQRPASRVYHLLLAEIHRASGDDKARGETLSIAASLSAKPDVLAARLTLPERHRWLMSAVSPSSK